MNNNDLLATLQTYFAFHPEYSTKDKGDKFEQAVLFFLRFDKTQKSIFQKVQPYSDFAKEHKLPVRDLGIDLVATTHDDRYFAVQCKYYHDRCHSVTFKEVSTFISLVGACKIFRGGGGAILATTSDQPPGPNLTKIIQSTPYKWIWLNLNKLNAASFSWSDWIKGKLNQRVIPPLRPYQTEAVKKVIAGFYKHDRGKLIMACGTGKTRTALEITQEWISQNSLTNAKILVTVPSINLVQQTLTEFNANQKHDFMSIAVCSDTSAGKISSRYENEILEYVSVPVLATSDDIRNRLVNHHEQKPIIIFSTYQSLRKISAAQFTAAGQQQFTFDLIICDEAHRTTSKQQKSSDRLFTIVHHNQKINGRKRLYMTATPKIYQIKDEVKWAQLERDNTQVISMDDESLFGPEFYKYSFRDAIDEQQLVPYKLIILTKNRDDLPPETKLKIKQVVKNLKIPNKENNKQEGENYGTKLWGSFQALGGDVIGIDDFETVFPPLRKVISFNRTIRWSKFNSNPEIVLEIQKIGQKLHPKLQNHTWTWRHIDGTTLLTDRRATLTWLQAAEDWNETRIISNVRCFGEGVDVPALDAVLFLDPKQSGIEIIQAIGRVMRKAKDKTTGYIILPVTYSYQTLKNLTQDDPEFINQNKEWTMIIKVINALASHDEKLADQLTRYKISFDKSFLCPPKVIEGSPKNPGLINIGGQSQNYSQSQMQLFEKINWYIRAQIIPAAGPHARSQPEYMRYIGKIAQDIKSKINSEYYQYESEITTLQQVISKYWQTECSFDDALQLTIQHLVIQPCFARIFSDVDWINTNPVVQALNQMVAKFESFFQKKINSDRVWDYFLLYLENATKKIKKEKDPVQKSHKTNFFLTNFFNDFWQYGFKTEQKRYGIVYTPPDVVKWMVSGLDYLIQTELKISTGVKDPQIKIIDPFFGTGSFLTYLVKHYGIKNSVDFISNKIFGSEIQPVAYYWTWIALLNLTQSQIYEKTLQTNIYKLNQNLLWSDTLKLNLTNKGQTGFDFWPKLNQLKTRFSNRIKQINIIIANPPYGQVFGSKNIRLTYPILTQFIQSNWATNPKYLFGAQKIYNQATFCLAWMIQLLENSQSNFGIIALICPNTFVRGKGAPAMRDWLNHHFTKIYSFDLRGNFYDLQLQGVQDEGENIFGNRSTTGIQILFLVWHRRPQYNQLGTFYYLDINQLLGSNPKTADHKLAVLNDHSFSQLVIDGKFDLLKLNSEGGWLGLSIDKYYFFKTTELFWTNCAGFHDGGNINIFCNFSDQRLIQNVTKLHDTYQLWFNRMQQNKFDFKRCLNSFGMSKRLCLKSSHKQTPELIAKKYLTFLHYTPFVLTRAYVSRFYALQFGSVNPDLDQPWTKLGIMIPKKSFGSNFTAWAINLHNHPFYHMYFHYINFYPFRTPSSTHSSLLTTSQYNLKPDFISFMQYPNHPVSEHDIFCYIYGLLWSSDYRTYIQKYVWTHPPAICKFKSWSLFSDIVKIGRQLIDLHTTWEKIDINRIEHYGANLNLSADSYRIHKIKWAQTTIIINSKSKKVNVQSRIIFNNLITLQNIPQPAYFLKFDGVPAVKHFMSRYQRKFDKKTGILNDPNEFVLVEQNPCYLLETLLKIIHISTETKKLVDQIPNLNFEVQNLVSKK